MIAFARSHASFVFFFFDRVGRLEAKDSFSSDVIERLIFT